MHNVARAAVAQKNKNKMDFHQDAAVSATAVSPADAAPAVGFQWYFATSSLLYC